MIFLHFVTRHNIVDGNLVDILDYFFTSLVLGYRASCYIIVDRFLCKDLVKKNIKNVIIDKYDFKKITLFLQNIKLIRIEELRFTYKDVYIIFGYNTLSFLNRFSNLMKRLKIIYFSEWKESQMFKHISNFISMYEMPFSFGNIRYKFKFAFPLYKKIRFVSKRVFIRKNFKFEQYRIFSIKRFRESFSALIYVKTKNDINPRPRIFHECLFDKKDVYFLDLDPETKNGASYRFQECKISGERCLELRTLTKEDEFYHVYERLCSLQRY